MLIIGTSPNNSSRRVGTGVALGTCGELVQGFTASGMPFHVTCPIEKSASVSVRLEPADAFSVVQTQVNFKKIELSLLRTAEYLKLEPYTIHAAHWTDLDVGKGLGSSTADIVAAARAMAQAADKSLNSAELAEIATSIESSDGSMHEGIVAFDQKSGGIVRRFSWWPQFLVVMVVPDRKLNTESANFSGKTALGPEFDQILRQLETAADERDAKGFAEAATRSADMNQQFVPNPYHALLKDRLSDIGALGINVGHTGTVVGLLFDAHDPNTNKLAASASIDLQTAFPDCKIEVTLTPQSPN